MAKQEKSNINDLLNQCGPNSSAAPRKSPLQKKIEKLVKNKKVSAADVLELCKKEMSLEAIAKHLGISTVSVATYIERLLRKGEAIAIDTYVSSQKRTEIEDAFVEMQTVSIKRIAHYLAEKATVEEIRIVRGYLQYKQKSMLDGEFC